MFMACGVTTKMCFQRPLRLEALSAAGTGGVAAAPLLKQHSGKLCELCLEGGGAAEDLSDV